MLDLRKIAGRVERVPLGLLRADVVIGAVDSRVARQAINQRAWRIGCPWIDTGVDGGGLLARANVYVPGADSPCLECAWSKADYKTLELTYPCSHGGSETAPTNASSALGALAASLAAAECQKLLDGDLEHSLVSRQVLVDLRHHQHFVTEYRRNPRCLFDHQVWPIEPVGFRPAKVSLEDAFELAGAGADRSRQSAFEVEGFKFARYRHCPDCRDGPHEYLCLSGRVPPSRRTCPRCGTPLVARGIDLLETLGRQSLSRKDLGRSLSSLGLRIGDVFTVSSPGGERLFEIRPDERTRIEPQHQNTVTLIGLGLIGSHLVPHLGRMKGLRRVTLVDFDRYEEKNCWSQNIVRRDVGDRKVDAQERQLRRINGDK